ncbi:hypothetical protein CTM59_08805 [Prevotella intermedia]|uniref:Uncharacterized protein n=2 Tax=Prevotella intermedia TaxID=28131 RepID=A0A2M8TJW8_PREIN|nr:hypothetical protein [Prevotella intermedia]PJI24227.1 hypothetical protein CTM59_08805 [Prevotella intermedia]
MENSCKNNELEKYREAIEQYAKERKNSLILNGGNEHALIILENIFKNAEKKIRIAAEQLYNDEVVNTPCYIDSMRKFLNRDKTELCIIIAKKPPKDVCKKENSFYHMLYKHSAYKENRIKIKAEGKFKVKGSDNSVNFCTGDDSMYRFEYSVEKRKALVNFNDKTRTEQLNNLFDKNFNELLNDDKLLDLALFCE